MTLPDFRAVLRASWMATALTTLVGAGVGGGLSLVMTPVYQAQAQLFVSVQNADEISGAYTGGLYVQQRIKSFATVVDTPGVLDPVIEDLDLDVDNSKLAEQVSAQNPPGTILLNVVAKAGDARQAAEIADATAGSLAAEIVRLEATDSGAEPVHVELIRPAQVPGGPVSPRFGPNVLACALLGLLGGFAIAIVRATLDTSVKSVEDLQGSAQSPVLGTIAVDPDADKKPLVALRGNPRAEAYRCIRTNLRYLDVDNPPRSLVITSSLPLEGKSTIAANLAIAQAQGGAKVLLVEADLRRPRVCEYLGMDAAVGLTDILIGQARVKDAIVPWLGGLLDVLPSGPIPPNPSELLGSQQMTDLLAALVNRYDIVLLDAPPLLPVTDAAILSAAADGAILVTRCGLTRREHVEQSADSLRQVNARLYGAVLNFMPEREPAGYGYGYSESTRDGAGDSVKHGLLPDMPPPVPRIQAPDTGVERPAIEAVDEEGPDPPHAPIVPR